MEKKHRDSTQARLTQRFGNPLRITVTPIKLKSGGVEQQLRILEAFRLVGQTVLDRSISEDEIFGLQAIGEADHMMQKEEVSKITAICRGPFVLGSGNGLNQASG